MITRTELEHAAFWGKEVCLKCGHIQDADESGPDEPGEPAFCLECTHPGVVPAALALNFLELISEEE